MESIDSFVADHHFPGPPGALQSDLSHRAYPLYFPNRCEAVYRLTLRSQRQWKALWYQIMATRKVHLCAHLPRTRPITILLVLQSPCASFKLPLIARLQVDIYAEHSVAVVDEPTLSWRLGAIRLGRALPEDEPREFNDIPLGAQILRHRPTPREFGGRRFRLRPDLPAPASAIAFSPQLIPVVIALRSGFLNLDELLNQTSLPLHTICDFLSALEAADLLVDPPTPLMSTDDPFEYFAIHWSAHDSEIRRRYSELKLLARTHPDKDQHLRRLGIAFDLLCRPEHRRALRRAKLHPPIISEVTDHLRRLVARAHRTIQLEEAVDLCHRILELAPYDRDIQALLSRLLCYSNPEGQDKSPFDGAGGQSSHEVRL